LHLKRLVDEKSVVVELGDEMRFFRVDFRLRVAVAEVREEEF